MTNLKKISIIIISYNTKFLTLQTLSSVYQNVLQSKNLNLQEIEIIAVDNNSADDSLEAIKKWQESHPKIELKIIANQENSGFAKANNQASQIAKGTFLLLLNSDTILKNNFLEVMLETAEKNPNTILAGNLLNQDNTPQAQGGDLPSLLALTSQFLFLDDLPIIGKRLPSTQHTGLSKHAKPAKHYKFTKTSQDIDANRNTNLNQHINLNKQIDSNTPDSQTQTQNQNQAQTQIQDQNQTHTQNPTQTQNQTHTQNQNLLIKGWVAGTAMMINTELYHKLKGLNEEFFMYGEDVEFCLRASKIAIDCAIVTDADCIHLKSASSSSANAIISEVLGYQKIFKLHYPFWQRPIATTIMLKGLFIRTIIFATIGQKKKASIYQEALKALVQKPLTK